MPQFRTNDTTAIRLKQLIAYNCSNSWKEAQYIVHLCFNSRPILSLCGKHRSETVVFTQSKSYCLPRRLYDCEILHFSNRQGRATKRGEGRIYEADQNGDNLLISRACLRISD